MTFDGTLVRSARSRHVAIIVTEYVAEFEASEHISELNVAVAEDIAESDIGHYALYNAYLFVNCAVLLIPARLVRSCAVT